MIDSNEFEKAYEEIDILWGQAKKDACNRSNSLQTELSYRRELAFAEVLHILDKIRRKSQTETKSHRVIVREIDGGKLCFACAVREILYKARRDGDCKEYMIERDDSFPIICDRCNARLTVI